MALSCPFYIDSFGTKLSVIIQSYLTRKNGLLILLNNFQFEGAQKTRSKKTCAKPVRK